MNDMFMKRETYYRNTRSQNDFTLPRVKTVNWGTESIHFMGPKLWELVPENIKMASSLSVFKKYIKNWVPLDCPCRLCKDYIPGVGFLN